MASGEDPVSLITNNIQIAVSNTLVTGLSNQTLSTPSTAAQSAYGAVPPKLALGPDGVSSCQFAGGYAQLSLMQWGNNPYPDSQSVKSPLLRFSSTSTATTLPKTNISANAVRNKRIIPLPGVPAYTIALQFSTPQAFNFSAQETGLRKSNFTLPTCTLFNGVTYIPCRGCNISSYTNFNVTYSCFDMTQLCPVATSIRRNLKGGKDGDGFNDAEGESRDSQSTSLEEVSVYGALLETIGAELSSTLSSNPFALDLSKAVAILSFMGVLIGFIVICLVRLLQLDYHEKIQKTYVLKEHRAKARELMETDASKGGNGDRSAVYFDHIKKIKAEYKSKNKPALTYLKGMSKKSEKVQRAQPDIDSDESPDDKSDIDGMVGKDDEKVERKYAFMSMAVVDFMHDIIPSTNILTKNRGNLFHNIFINHEYFRCFSSVPMGTSRTIRFLEVVIAVLTALFADTLFFGIFFPSDGTCSIYKTEVSQLVCLLITHL